MIKARLMFSHKDGEKADYGLNFEFQELPRPGDYIRIRRSNSGRAGTEDFIVVRTRWDLDYHPDDGTGSGVEDAKNPKYGSVTEVMVECRFAVGAYSSDEHIRNAGKDAESI